MVIKKKPLPIYVPLVTASFMEAECNLGSCYFKARVREWGEELQWNSPSFGYSGKISRTLNLNPHLLNRIIIFIEQWKTTNGVETISVKLETVIKRKLQRTPCNMNVILIAFHEFAKKSLVTSSIAIYRFRGCYGHLNTSQRVLSPDIFKIQNRMIWKIPLNMRFFIILLPWFIVPPIAMYHRLQRQIL